MGDQKDKTYVTDIPKNTEHHGKSGGHMGAGKSGRENMGTEKPSDDNRMGSQKPNTAHNKDSSDDSGSQSEE
jgi:hypothetical protein